MLTLFTFTFAKRCIQCNMIAHRKFIRKFGTQITSDSLCQLAPRVNLTTKLRDVICLDINDKHRPQPTEMKCWSHHNVLHMLMVILPNHFRLMSRWALGLQGSWCSCTGNVRHCMQYEESIQVCNILHEDLLSTAMRRKWYSHVTSPTSMANAFLQGAVSDRRRRIWWIVTVGFIVQDIFLRIQIKIWWAISHVTHLQLPNHLIKLQINNIY